MKNLLIGIDIGTSGLKTAVFSPETGLVAAVSEDYPVDYPHPGWAEQDPDIWWNAVVRSLNRLWTEEKVDPADVAGLAVDGQSWSCIPIDRQGRVLHKTPQGRGQR